MYVPRLQRAAFLSALMFTASLLAAGKAEATVSLTYSGFSSDKTDPAVLDATVNFTVVDGTLKVEILNESLYKIAQLYFNTDSTLTALTYASLTTNDSNLLTPPVITGGSTQTQNANGFGNYNYLIDFGSGDGRLDAGKTVTLILNMTGTTSESTIETKFSSLPPGHQQAISAMKFEAGPKGDSAFGTGSGDGSPPPPPPVPEPASLATAGLGVLMGLGYAWRRRKRVAA